MSGTKSFQPMWVVLLAASLCSPPQLLSQIPAASPDRTELLSRVQRAIAAGRPFAATQLLNPTLAAGNGKDPAAVLLAARAAAGWGGWATVVRLLESQPWLDEVDGGEGRALLARARVERDQAPMEDAQRAVSLAREGTLGPRLVTLGRALDRANLSDSAAAIYLHAARALPSVGDWLRLRAAGVLADSTTRTTMLREVTLPAAVGRVRWTDALARDRSGDWRGAARVYEGLGASLAAARLRLRAARESGVAADLAASRRELMALLTRRLSAEDTRDAIALVDGAFPNLTPDEQLLVARRAAAADPARAARGFAQASIGGARARPLADADKLTYATVLQRLGRHREAAVVLGSIRGRELQAEALYLRGRSLLALGSRPQAQKLLREALAVPGDSGIRATAGYLLADLLVDDDKESGARQVYLEVARRFPRTSHGQRAALQAALLAWAHGDRAAAGKEFAALAERAGESSEGIAALYWSGRAALASGDTASAAARWRSLLQRFPSSYYTVPAAERLGVPAVQEPPIAPTPQDNGNGITGPTSEAFDRAELLDRLGLRVEARFEYDWLARQAENAPGGLGALLGTVRAFLDRGLTGRAYRLALRAPEARTRREAFPLPGPETLAEAQRQGVDPWLIAALIRQESGFEPAARSRANARGLMQVLPSLGAGMAATVGIRDWDPALLYQPEINVQFGVAHLAQTLRRYSRLPVALAAYNAGERPAERWLGLPGAATDPDLFIERIQFAETRDYVRRVLRNFAVYRAFYPSLP